MAHQNTYNLLLLFVRLGASEALEAVEGLDEGSKVAALKKAAQAALNAKVEEDSSILQLADTDFFLGRICSAKGDIKFSAGTPRYASCLMCRKYDPKKSTTNFVCLRCGTPICIRDRGRGMTCLYEHLNGTDPVFKCDGTTTIVGVEGPTGHKRIIYGNQVVNDTTGVEYYTDKVKL